MNDLVTDRAEESLQFKRNPAWTRDELILALDLYVRHGGSQPSQASDDVESLSDFLGRMARARGVGNNGTLRNSNGVIMKLMNFRRFDPKFTGGRYARTADQYAEI